jgi:hypothetical protein
MTLPNIDAAQSDSSYHDVPKVSCGFARSSDALKRHFPDLVVSKQKLRRADAIAWVGLSTFASWFPSRGRTLAPRQTPECSGSSQQNARRAKPWAKARLVEANTQSILGPLARTVREAAITRQPSSLSRQKYFCLC